MSVTNTFEVKKRWDKDEWETAIFSFQKLSTCEPYARL